MRFPLFLRVWSDGVAPDSTLLTAQKKRQHGTLRVLYPQLVADHMLMSHDVVIFGGIVLVVTFLVGSHTVQSIFARQCGSQS